MGSLMQHHKPLRPRSSDDGELSLVSQECSSVEYGCLLKALLYTRIYTYYSFQDREGEKPRLQTECGYCGRTSKIYTSPPPIFLEPPSPTNL